LAVNRTPTTPTGLTKPHGFVPAVALVHQNQVGFSLQGQRDAFRLSRVQVLAEGRDQQPVFRCVALNPGRGGDFIPARPMLPRRVEFVPNSFGDVQRTVELPQQQELTDGGQIGQGRGIADHQAHKFSPKARRFAKSSARSSVS